MNEILAIAQDGEVTLRDMINYAKIMSEKWGVKANAASRYKQRFIYLQC
jgi:hypothetical protein